MKFGCTTTVAGEQPLAVLRDDARLLEDLGFDLLWLDEERGVGAPLVWAAAVGGLVAHLRVAAAVALGGTHPLYVAEESAVADQALGGRLVLAVRPAPGAEEHFGEAVDLVLHAHAPRPFRHDGHWRVPARLPGNRFNLEERVRVTPAPAQLELPVWVLGEPEVAVTLGLAFVVDGDEAPPQSGARLRRPALLPVAVDAAGDLDHAGLVQRLRAAERHWGLDVAVLDLPDDLAPVARARALGTIAQRVRPRVQLDRLPPGLEAHWDATLEDAPVG